jgi:hypothetical protein
MKSSSALMVILVLQAVLVTGILAAVSKENGTFVDAEIAG